MIWSHLFLPYRLNSRRDSEWRKENLFHRAMSAKSPAREESKASAQNSRPTSNVSGGCISSCSLPQLWSLFSACTSKQLSFPGLSSWELRQNHNTDLHYRVYVAFPHIAQNGINDSTLEIQSLTLSNPTPNSFHLQQTAKLTNHNRYHPRLDAFNASLSVGGAEAKPYAYIELPAVHATETTYTNIDQEVQITDMDAFIDYNTQLLTQESVDLVVKGRTKLHEGRLPATTVDFEKTITMKGMQYPLLPPWSYTSSLEYVSS